MYNNFRYINWSCSHDSYCVIHMYSGSYILLREEVKVGKKSIYWLKTKFIDFTSRIFVVAIYISILVLYSNMSNCRIKLRVFVNINIDDKYYHIYICVISGNDIRTWQMHMAIFTLKTPHMGEPSWTPRWGRWMMMTTDWP